ncbi:hemophilus-specific protein [Pasteurella multocida]|uniref:hemophilus-specific protein n=1 Tax=Pasteurella multocida TaxID=747 RepID=UPI0029B0E5B2|nr:hemophilus-specific protein [Pasteurella multocida]MDX3903958.1 hemophilus-specific protein [Pasteurella multocida]MDX3983534.1 hemophilus-specific protein [Pasteurella multocida]
MLVHVRLSCIGDVLPTKFNEWLPEHHTLHHEISHKALEAWQNRDKDTQSVRFMQQMPARQGLHFRFLSVSEQDGKLIVSRS